MAEGHLEKHRHGEPAETVEQLCNKRIPQGQSELYSQSDGKGRSQGMEEVNTAIDLLVWVIFLNWLWAEAEWWNLTRWVWEQGGFHGHNLCQCHFGHHFDVCRKPLKGQQARGELTSGSMYCTSPTREIIPTWYSISSIQNSHQLHSDMTANRLWWEDKRKTESVWWVLLTDLCSLLKLELVSP